jgi:hypothetical protein
MPYARRAGVIILRLPRGGVPVAAEVAPMDEREVEEPGALKVYARDADEVCLASRLLVDDGSDVRARERVDDERRGRCVGTMSRPEVSG